MNRTASLGAGRLLALACLSLAFAFAAPRPSDAQQLTPRGVKPSDTRSDETFYWCANCAKAHPGQKHNDWMSFRLATMRSNSAAARGSGIPFSETEPNSSLGAANVLPLQSGVPSATAVDVSATIADPFPTATPVASTEDNDSIGTANALGIVGGSPGNVTISGMIGDGVFGATSGDYDFYSFSANVGQFLVLDVETPAHGTSGLDSQIGLYNSAGTLVAFNDDEDLGGGNFDSLFSGFVPVSDTYTLAIGSYVNNAFQVDLPTNPFTPGTGRGASTTGTYTISVRLDADDIDFFRVDDLAAGDVLAVNVNGAAHFITILNEAGEFRFGSSQDASPAGPPASLIPMGGTASATYIQRTDVPDLVVGIFGLGALGAYSAEFRALRPGLEAQPVANHQIIFLDFDGATINPFSLGGPNAMRVLSPLSSFLTAWGLSAGDESAVIDAIVASVTETLSTSLRGAASVRNGDFDASDTPGEMDVTILNSRDHADLFGQKNVSRVIIGGTVGQLGIETIGIAESIDVGNYGTQETAVVLLDFLSEVASDPNSLNQYAIDAGTSKIALIGQGVGNITAHEIGHYIGNWHTDQFNATPNIMDQGGNLSNSVGVGADEIFGTPDDFDVDFVTDEYVPDEGFLGFEDTGTRSAFGLATGRQSGDYRDLLDTTSILYSTLDGNDSITVTSGMPGIVVVDDHGLTPGGPQLFSGVTSITIEGRGGDDTFSVTPSDSIVLLLDGGAHASGDRLVFNPLGMSTTPPAPPAGSGTIGVSGRADTTYANVESVALVGPANVLRME